MQSLAMKFTLLVVIALTISCRPTEMTIATPGASPGSRPALKTEPQDPPPTPLVKSSAPQDKSLPPTPTLRPQATPPHPPTAMANHLEIVTYEQSSSPEFVAPFIEKDMATAVPPPVKCDERMPGSDLLSLVTKEYGLSKDFVPDDLIPLAGHVPYSVTIGYPSEIRQVMLDPLVEMINDMIAADLRPQVLSGYRSYAAQAISWNKWNTLYPERAAIISAQPGHSEHQLGTVIDFGSPELPGIVGQAGIQFHTYFYKTSEGEWLAENAHKYGFTLSFTEEAFDTTGFYYEPWHFRYVGEAMAAQLREHNLTLTEYQLANAPIPCIP